MVAKKKTAPKAPPRAATRRAVPKKGGMIHKLMRKSGGRLAGAASSAGFGALEAAAPKPAFWGQILTVALGSIVEAFAPDGSVLENVAGNMASSNAGALAHSKAKSYTTQKLEARQAEIEERARTIAREQLDDYLPPEMDEEREEVAVQAAPPRRSRSKKEAQA